MNMADIDIYYKACSPEKRGARFIFYSRIIKT
jgi:hypothetical protein